MVLKKGRFDQKSIDALLLLVVFVLLGYPQGMIKRMWGCHIYEHNMSKLWPQSSNITNIIIGQHEFIKNLLYQTPA